MFSRIVVSDWGTVTYDIWRATSKHGLQNLHFVLISPAQRPIESTRYTVFESTAKCDDIGLSFYRNATRTFPEILILSYRNDHRPLTSGGQPLTPLDFQQDQTEIACLAKTFDRHFYSTLSAAERVRLSDGIPRC